MQTNISLLQLNAPHSVFNLLTSYVCLIFPFYNSTVNITVCERVTQSREVGVCVGGGGRKG